MGEIRTLGSVACMYPGEGPLWWQGLSFKKKLFKLYFFLNFFFLNFFNVFLILCYSMHNSKIKIFLKITFD
jgi:hypothetical protein